MNDQTKMWVYAIGGGAILALIAAKSASAQTPSAAGSKNSGAPACQSVQVTTVSSPLIIRALPAVTSNRVGSLDPGTVVSVSNAVEGESVSGNTLWYKLADGRGYITSAYSRCL